MVMCPQLPPLADGTPATSHNNRNDATSDCPMGYSKVASHLPQQRGNPDFPAPYQQVTKDGKHHGEAWESDDLMSASQPLALSPTSAFPSIEGVTFPPVKFREACPGQSPPRANTPKGLPTVSLGAGTQ